MNPTLILTIVIGFFSLSDFISPNENKKLHQLIYIFSFFFSYFIVSIKFYYGPDIANYVPHYESMKEPITTWDNGFRNNIFEPGYELFCSVLKYIGVNYWGMTYLVTTFYFYTIYVVFKRLSGYKTFALLLLIFFEHNLLFFEIRQSISVCFFILSFLAYDKNKYIKSIFFILLAGLFHKAGIIIGALTYIFINIKGIKFSKSYYLLSCIMLIFLVLFDLKPLLNFIVNLLPINQIAKKSIEHHLILTRNIQVIAPFYILILYTIYFCGNQHIFNKNWHRLMILFFGFITVLYQDFFLLNRLRSFFMPIAIVYVINILNNSEIKKGVLYKQLSVLLFYVTGVIAGVKLEYEGRRFKSGVTEYTTVFSLLNDNENHIKKDKLKRADIYWQKEYLKEK